jgi:hypothetical protein
VKQLPLLSELHDQVNHVIGLDDLIQLDNVRMPRITQDFDLPVYSDFVLLILNGRFVDYLNRYFLLGYRMDSLFNFPERTLSDCFANFVITNNFWNQWSLKL